jgi:aconitate hydratase
VFKLVTIIPIRLAIPCRDDAVVERRAKRFDLLVRPARVHPVGQEHHGQIYHDRALEHRDAGGHGIIGGDNYGQGSSREHAAIAPRYLGLRVVIAKSFARIHWQNLVNFGVLPLTFANEADYDRVEKGETLVLEHLREALSRDQSYEVKLESGGSIEVEHGPSERQLVVLRRGGLINWKRDEAS